jgi:hypothetical protein
MWTKGADPLVGESIGSGAGYLDECVVANALTDLYCEVGRRLQIQFTWT